MSTSPDPRACRDTVSGVAVLAGVLAAAVAVALVVGAGRPLWGMAVFYAAVITGVSNIAGWLVARRATTDPAGRSAAALGATALRLGPGLVALAAIAARGGPLRDAGAGGLIVAFYLALLAATILLHMMVDRGGFPPRSDVRR